MQTLDHPPRITVVGYGRWGRQCHSYLINTTPGLELRAIVSSDPEKRRQAEADRNCLTFETFEQALNDPETDVIFLATPNNTHAPLAIRALDAGKHVVTEKVMCLNVEECDAMIAAAERNERLLTVFQNRRFDGDYLTVRQLLDSGELGELRWLEMAWQGFAVWGGWRGTQKAGGGKLYDLGAHLLDQILQICPEPVESVYCRMHHDSEEFDIETEAMVVITFNSGKTAVIDVSSMAAIQKPRFYVRGTKGTYEKYGLDPQEDAMKQGNIDAAVESEEHFGRFKRSGDEKIIPTLSGRWRNFYENLRETLQGGATPVVTTAEARRLISVIEAARESARENRVVTL